MARFSGNPIKSPLVGNEYIPATDPATTNDISFTPLIITQFVATNMALASGSTNGLIDGPNYAKLLALPSAAQLATDLGELGQVAFPIFIAAPSNGALTIYQHVLSVPWQVSSMTLFCSAGSTNVSFTKNGNPIVFVGGTSVPITTVSSTQIAGDTTPNETFQPGDKLGIILSGTTGNCVNVGISVLLNEHL
jgi:hypothetical protein